MDLADEAVCNSCSLCAAVLVAGFPSLSPFMVMFQGKPLARLCALNPNSPRASTAFVANSRFVQAMQHLAGPQK